MTTEHLCTNAQQPPLPTLSTPGHRGVSTQAEGGDQREMLSHIRQYAPGLLNRLQSGLSNLPVELVWAAHSQWPLPPSPSIKPPRNTQNLIRISVLDSSFNPPTLAHLALANSPRPSYTTESIGAEYEAKLLLLSVKNVDKALKAGDATYLQRLQMMGLLAQDLSVRDGNVAIAITDEPTFVGKSKVLQEYLKARLASLPPENTPQLPMGPPNTQLSFVIGLDTLERLFSPKYYPPPPGSQATHEEMMIGVLSRMLSPFTQGGDNSLVVCARRSTTLPSDVGQSPKSTLDLGEAEGWMKKRDALSGDATSSDSHSSHAASAVSGPGDHREIPKDERIVIIDIGDRASKFSSTAVRNARSCIGVLGANAGEGPWRECVTDSVAKYVEEEGLYVS